MGVRGSSNHDSLEEKSEAHSPEGHEEEELGREGKNPTLQKQYEHPEVSLQHSHSYVATKVAFTKVLKENEEIIFTKAGQARSISREKKIKDKRAGVYPQHNSSGAFSQNLEILTAIDVNAEYKHLFDATQLLENGFQWKEVTVTKRMLDITFQQMANLSRKAFEEMLCMSGKEKRDFQLLLKKDEKTNVAWVAYTNPEHHLTEFIQKVQYDDDHRVKGIEHCLFECGEALVINSSLIDKYGQYRQFAHIGGKGENKKAFNAIERFDDGTVNWIVTMLETQETGIAALKPDGEIIIVNEQISAASMLAARNFGAEGLDENNNWTGKFSLKACLANDHPLQKEYKDAIRNQVNQLLDGAILPGLRPIFDIGNFHLA